MGEAANRHEVIMAGIGGQGVLMVGELLARAGMFKYKHTLWIPSFWAAKRGGAVECTVILADEEIASL